MIQGDVYWVTLHKPDKRRPVLILTRSSAIPALNSVVVASITTTIRDIGSQIVLGPEEGMPEDCTVSLDNLHTVPKRNFGAYITHLPGTKMLEVFEGIKFTFGIED